MLAHVSSYIQPGRSKRAKSYLEPLWNYSSPELIRGLGGDTATAIIYNKLLHISQWNKTAFHVSQESLTGKTGLTISQVRRAISKLQQKQLIRIHKGGGWHNKNYYEVQKLETTKNKTIKTAPQLVKVLGSNTAIVFSQMQFRNNINNHDWSYPASQLSKDTGLSEPQIRYAIKKLKQQDCITSRLAGDPRRAWYTIKPAPKQMEKNDIIDKIIEDFNLVTGKHIIRPSEKMIIQINHLLSQGHTLDDFKLVHRFLKWKWKDWTKASLMMTPKTILRNFYEYLGEARENKWLMDAQTILSEELAQELFKQAQTCYRRNPGCSASKQSKDPTKACFWCTRHQNLTFVQLYKTALQLLTSDKPKMIICATVSTGTAVERNQEVMPVTLPLDGGGLSEFMPNWRDKITKKEDK